MNVTNYVPHFAERLGLFFREMWFTYDCVPSQSGVSEGGPLSKMV